MTIQESKKRDTKCIMFLLRSFRNELVQGYIKPESNYAYLRYLEVYNFINGYSLGSQTCTTHKLNLAENYLDRLASNYEISLKF